MVACVIFFQFLVWSSPLLVVYALCMYCFKEWWFLPRVDCLLQTFRHSLHLGTFHPSKHHHLQGLSLPMRLTLISLNPEGFHDRPKTGAFSTLLSSLIYWLNDQVIDTRGPHARFQLSDRWVCGIRPCMCSDIHRHVSHLNPTSASNAFHSYRDYSIHLKWLPALLLWSPNCRNR